MGITKRRSPKPYSKPYRDIAFHIWYSKGRPAITSLEHLVDEREDGTKPNHITLGKWKKEDDWVEKADALDEDVAVEIQKKHIQDRVEMFEKHIIVAKDLQEKALDAIEKIGINTPHEAMRLLEIGLNLERSSVGIPDILDKIKDMQDEELRDKLAKLMKKGKFEEKIIKDELGEGNE